MRFRHGQRTKYRHAALVDDFHISSGVEGDGALTAVVICNQRDSTAAGDGHTISSGHIQFWGGHR